MIAAMILAVLFLTVLVAAGARAAHLRLASRRDEAFHAEYEALCDDHFACVWDWHVARIKAALEQDNQ